MSREEDLPSAKGAVPEVQIELPDDDFALPDPSELERLMAGLDKAASLPRGEIVPGKVLQVTETEVIVDVGLKTEAAIPLVEFQSEDGRVSVQEGDATEVWVEAPDSPEGALRFSRLRAARLKVWDEIERAFRDQSTLTGRVMDRIKGGLIVDLGVKAFLPTSHADLRPLRDPDALLGQQIPVKVLKVTRKRSNVVVSRKLVLEEEARRRKEELLGRLREGEVLAGRVKNLTDYGAFIDLGGMDGLLHVTDLAWERVQHPSELLRVGQEITVQVLRFDAEKGRISLGRKQLTPDPWERVARHYQPGDRLTGRVVSLTDYGAFIEIEPGVEGLLHVSEMTWSRHVEHPSKLLHQGDRVEVAVLEVHPRERRLSLSLKRTLPDPWEEVPARYPLGAEVEAQVRNLTDFGAFVEIAPGVEGLIHISDLSWKKKLKHPSDVLKKGQRVKAVILRVAQQERRISLGLKQLETDPWESFLASTRVGDRVRGKVVRKAAFGAFVELSEGVEGLCHNSELGEGPAEIGAEYDFRVIRLNPGEKKIGLSRKEAPRPAAAEPPPPPVETFTTMGAAFSSAGITPASLAPRAPAEENSPAETDAPSPAPALPVSRRTNQRAAANEDPSLPEPSSPQAIPLPQGVSHDQG